MHGKYLILNPDKGLRWVTKGINLNMKHPAAQIPMELEDEFVMRVRTAIANEEVFLVDQLDGVSLGSGNKQTVEMATIQDDDDGDGKVIWNKNDDGKWYATIKLDGAAIDKDAPVTMFGGGVIGRIQEERDK